MGSRKVNLNLYVPASLAAHLKAFAEREKTPIGGLLEKWASDDPRSRYMPDAMVGYVLRDYFHAEDLSPSQARGQAIGHLVERSHLSRPQAEAVANSLDWTHRTPRPRRATPEEMAAQRDREAMVVDSVHALNSGVHPDQLERDLMTPNGQRRTGFSISEARAIVSEARQRVALASLTQLDKV